MTKSCFQILDAFIAFYLKSDDTRKQHLAQAHLRCESLDHSPIPLKAIL